MQIKNVAIIASIIIGIVIVGTIIAIINSTQNNVDIYAVNSDTLDMLLQNKGYVLVIDIRLLNNINQDICMAHHMTFEFSNYRKTDENHSK